jgi:hypothetical protein
MISRTTIYISDRTGLYVESHGIVANVSHRQEFLKSSDLSPFSRISGMQRQIRNFTITTSRPVGNPTGGLENPWEIFVPTVAHFADTWQMWETVGKAGLITANLMWCASTCFWFCDYQIGASGQVLPKPYPGLRTHISCPGQCVTKSLTSERLSWNLDRIKFLWIPNLLKYWNGLISRSTNGLSLSSVSP